MQNLAVYDHPVDSIELVETHISWVILTGKFAYKIKKPVDFGFLDFSTLKKRRRCCEQELRLNRRLAPGLYLDVVAISGVQNKPVINGEGEVLEYAVKMQQFAQTAQLDHMLKNGELTTEHMEALAGMIADFHQVIGVAGDETEYGNKRNVYRPLEENFKQIREHMDTTGYETDLSLLEKWSQQAFVAGESDFSQRKRDGYIRECHGDMHLRNLLWLNNRPMAFDCIEFNPALSWIDVMSEVAFLVMDLQSREQSPLAYRFLNSYLEVTGDYAGLTVLRYYLCYRAMVRAKVAGLRLEQPATAEAQRLKLQTEFELYLELAKKYTQYPAPKLIIMCGLSASGKSTISRQITDAMGVIRVRSDVERKRLLGIALHDHNTSDTTLYSARVSRQTYEKLAEIASGVMGAGYSVLVDAAFLTYEQREKFQQLARHLGVSTLIVLVTASSDVLRQRILDRKNVISDAGIEVLEQQLLDWKPLREDEKARAIFVNTEENVEIGVLKNAINTH